MIFSYRRAAKQAELYQLRRVNDHASWASIWFIASALSMEFNDATYQYLAEAIIDGSSSSLEDINNQHSAKKREMI